MSVPSSFANSFLSPVVNRGVRKPFGEITNTPPSHSKRNPLHAPSSSNQTPAKPEVSSTPTDDKALTPMANLKLLIRVASEQASQQKPSRRELFKEENEENMDENRRHVDDHDYSHDSGRFSLSQAPSSASSTSSSVTGKVSRKDKSLGLLCDRFISRFPVEVGAGEKCEIQLDDLAKQMGTERRRIYDIVNVLESIQMMTKVGKNLYQWHGIHHQRMTLAWLRQLAEKLNMAQRYKEVKDLESNEQLTHMMHYSPRNERDLKRSPLNYSPANSSFSSISSASSMSPSPSPVERKTSLGVACQKFLMLFLIAPEPQTKINLDFAAKVIHGVGLPDAIMKTRIRRLYDIANILQSLKLIQKIQVVDSQGGKKPAFQYIGPFIEGIEVTKDVLKTLPATRQRHSLLTFGKNLLNIPDDPQEASKMANKKRLVPEDGFSTFNGISISHGHTLKMPRTQSVDFKFAVPRSNPPVSPLAHPLKRSSSLLDLSDVCEVERSRIQDANLINYQQPYYQRSPINLSKPKPKISPLNRSGNSLLKRALTSPAQLTAFHTSQPLANRPSPIQVLKFPNDQAPSVINGPNNQHLVKLNRVSSERVATVLGLERGNPFISKPNGEGAM
eukprot:maker-scaffold304_size215464-snap-gene-0.11 protein:Tk10782 transcript:maker-scaffold304_size215464-snap-gene-0.11-mRNA-1 annotation:"transcription factor e2f8"